MLTYYMTSLGLIPFFTSRAFTPLFASAMIARFAPHWTWLASLPGGQLLSQVPSWASSDMTLLVLFVVTLVEVGAAKSPEVRELLTLFDTKIKAVSAFLVCFAIVRGNPLELVEHVEKVGVSTQFAWGQSFAYTWAFAIGGVVWFSSTLRNAVFGFLMDVDPDDDLSLQGLLSWMEDAMGFFGVLFVVIMPAAALVASGLAILGLYLMRRYLEHREQSSKLPCPGCATSNPPCGIHCSSCGRRRARIQQVGLLGTVKDAVVTDLAAHRFQLLTRKRCSSCGERLKERRLSQSCTACGTQPFTGHQDVEEYLANLRATLPKTLAILLVLGFIPVVGLIPGIIYYRLSLIASLRTYLPRSVGFAGKWLVRIVNLVLVCLQPIPLLGMLTLPAMCLTNYGVYQGLLRSRIRRELSAGMAPAVVTG